MDAPQDKPQINKRRNSNTEVSKDSPHKKNNEAGISKGNPGKPNINNKRRNSNKEVGKDRHPKGSQGKPNINNKRRNSRTELSKDGPPQKKRKMEHEKEIREKAAKYKRASFTAAAKLEHKQALMKKASEAAARSELLLPESTGYMEPEGELDKTFRVTQSEIKEAVDLQTRDKIFSLHLPEFGPYSMEYSKDGRFVLLAGNKETIRDVAFLHNETMFAVAQKKQVYVYDSQGTEIHSLRRHSDVYALDFLPYHFLLTTIGKKGILRYQDISTGEIVSELNTKLGPCAVMKQNPYNAILHLGHQNGTVTLWSPNMNQPLVKMLCQRGALTDLAINRSGQYAINLSSLTNSIMVTTGLDSKIKVWDIRTYKKLATYSSPANQTIRSIDISQKGALALGFGSHVQDYAGKTPIQEPYLIHRLPNQNKISRVRFCPFEDVMGIGHEQGFDSIIVPGVGEPNFDTFEANPYQTTRQRRETTVARLLEKVPADMITLDPSAIATVTRDSSETLKKNQKLLLEANTPGAQWSAKKKEKKKSRGKNKASKKLAIKQHDYVTKTKETVQEAEKQKQKVGKPNEQGPQPQSDVVHSALDRFKKK